MEKRKIVKGMEKEMNEIRRIKVLDLIMTLLKKWKQIVCVILILEILAGGIGLVKGNPNKTTQPGEIKFSEADQKTYDRQEEALAKHQKDYAVYKNYLDESIKMQIDPENVYDGTIKCLISGQTQADVLRLRNECEKLVKSQSFYDAVRKKLNIESKNAYIQEIITMGFESYEDAAGMMTFSVIHYNKEACQDILDIIQNEIKKIEYSNGNCEVLSAVVLESAKLYLVSEKQNYYTLKWNAYDALIRVNEDRKKLEQSYNLSQITSEESNPIMSLRNMILVLLLGGGGAIIFYTMKYLFSESIHTSSDVNGLGDISVVTVCDKNKKTKGVIDGGIEKLNIKTGNKPSISLEMSILPIITKVKQRQLTEVCLTSTLFENVKNMDIVSQIQNVFEKYDIKVIVVCNILTDIDALQTAIKIGNIIFYEVCEKTKHQEMREEVLRSQQCGVDIQGVILEKK